MSRVVGWASNTGTWLTTNTLFHEGEKRMPRKSGNSNAAEHIQAAIASIDHQIKELSAQREQLVKIVPGITAASARRRGRPASALAAVRTTKPKRVVSDATKKKLKAAAKARWARYRGEIE
jgi:hypothetical protein